MVGFSLVQTKVKVSPNVKEATPVHETIVDSGILVSAALSGTTSAGLLSTLLTAPVNEIKNVAGTLNKVRYMSHHASNLLHSPLDRDIEETRIWLVAMV